MNTLVSVKLAVNKAQDRVGLMDDKDVPVLIDWAIEADKKIGSIYNWEERIHILEVDQCKTKLPCGTMAIVGVLFGDCGCDCGLAFDNTIYRAANGIVRSVGEGFILIDAASGNVQITDVRYTVQNNYIVFDSNYDGDKITIKTLGYKIDDDGFPMINENHVDAIASYLEWRLAKRERWGKRKITFGAGELREMERLWDTECANARSDDNLGNPSVERDVALVWNDPLTGYYQNYQLNRPLDDLYN